MNSISDYNERTSHHTLYAFLAQKIVAGEIDNYGDVIEILESLPRDKRILWVYPRVFALIRSIYWGFLKDLDKKTYPAMWDSFVIENPQFPGTGRLKRNSKILTLFAGIMDIHGYTTFCQKAGRNLSMLQLLDDCIQQDITKIAKQFGVLCQRSRGDEIILLGCKASSVFFTTMSIIDYFSKRHIIEHKGFRNARAGNRVMLPDMKVSAGISGGHKYTPLLVTRNGDLSGHLINSAARLQARANKLAPHDTKMLLTRQVLTKLNIEMKTDREVADKLKGMYFRNSGGVEFKGTQMWVVDVIFDKEELYKQKMDDGFERLYSAVSRQLWDRQIYEEIMGLVRTALTHMHQFTVSVENYGKIRNVDIVALCNKGLEEFLNSNQYDKALETIETVYLLVSKIPEFDHLLLEYLEEITKGYQHLRIAYLEELEDVLEEKAEFLLELEMRDLYVKAKREVDTYNKIRKVAMEHPKVGNRKALWLRVVGNSKRNPSLEGKLGTQQPVKTLKLDSQ